MVVLLQGTAEAQHEAFRTKVHAQRPTKPKTSGMLNSMTGFAAASIRPTGQASSATSRRFRPLGRPDAHAKWARHAKRHGGSAADARVVVRQDPLVVEQLRQWWDMVLANYYTFQRSMDVGSGALQVVGGVVGLDFEQYSELYARMYKALILPFDAAAARALVELDWELDAGVHAAAEHERRDDTHILSRELFEEALFGLADAWTYGCTADELAAFLSLLRDSIADGLVRTESAPALKPLSSIRRRALPELARDRAPADAWLRRAMQNKHSRAAAKAADDNRAADRTEYGEADIAAAQAAMDSALNPPQPSAKKAAWRKIGAASLFSARLTLAAASQPPAAAPAPANAPAAAASAPAPAEAAEEEDDEEERLELTGKALIAARGHAPMEATEFGSGVRPAVLSSRPAMPRASEWASVARPPQKRRTTPRASASSSASAPPAASAPAPEESEVASTEAPPAPPSAALPAVQRWRTGVLATTAASRAGSSPRHPSVALTSPVETAALDGPWRANKASWEADSMAMAMRYRRAAAAGGAQGGRPAPAAAPFSKGGMLLPPANDLWDTLDACHSGAGQPSATTTTQPAPSQPSVAATQPAVPSQPLMIPYASLSARTYAQRPFTVPDGAQRADYSRRGDAPRSARAAATGRAAVASITLAGPPSTSLWQPGSSRPSSSASQQRPSSSTGASMAAGARRPSMLLPPPVPPSTPLTGRTPRPSAEHYETASESLALPPGAFVPQHMRRGKTAAAVATMGPWDEVQ